MHAVCRREGARPITAGVVQQRVDGFSTKVGAFDFPFLPRLVGAEHERAFHRPDQK
jgi:hypothetical protein